MSGSKQLSVIALDLEATSGTAVSPTAASNAQLVRVTGLQIQIDEKFADRDVITASFEAPDRLPYARRGKIGFSVELQASGSLGVAPAWGKALQACGYGEAITATTRVDYTPVSSSIKTATIYAWYNNRLERFYMCSGTAKVSLTIGQVPSIDFEFTGLVTSVAGNAPPTPNLAAWIRAEAVSSAASSPLRIGAVTYNAGAVSGGTAYSWSSLEVDLGVDVQDLELVGTESIGIYGRVPKVMIKADFGGTDHAAFKADMHAGTPRAFGLTHGSAAGKKVGLYAPAGVIDSVGDEEKGPVLIDSMGMTLRPSSANDSLRIFCV